MKFKETLDNARAGFVAWNDKRKEKAAVRRMEKEAAKRFDAHHSSRFWLLNIPATATLCAAIVEVYWALLFCIEATGHVDFNYETAGGSTQPWAPLWNFAFSAHWPVLIGLLCATVPIVMLSMVWLPVQFAMRGTGRMRRGTIIAVGLLANVLVIVSGTVVMNYNRQDQVRAGLVVEQTADANRAMLAASVEDLQHELDTLMNHRSTYVATAASVGAVAYERDYVAQARATNDPRLPLLERALGSARRADELRASISEARRAVAAAQPAAATAANVEDTVGVGLNTFAQYVEVYRPPFVALICTLIGIFGAWWVVAILEGLNPRDVLRSGWADDAHRIEDLRDEEPVEAQGMKPPRRAFTEADTGEEIEQTLIPAHYRTIKKNKRTKVEIKPEIPPDETAAAIDNGDGGDRSKGVSAEERPDDEHPNEDQGHEGSADAKDASEDHLENTLSVTQDYLPEPDPDLYQDAGLVATEHASLITEDPADDESRADESQAGDDFEHHEPREQPETDESKLLTASVAAE